MKPAVHRLGRPAVPGRQAIEPGPLGQRDHVGDLDQGPQPEFSRGGGQRLCWLEPLRGSRAEMGGLFMKPCGIQPEAAMRFT
jgi:hypothetical protein